MSRKIMTAFLGSNQVLFHQTDDPLVSAPFKFIQGPSRSKFQENTKKAECFSKKAVNRGLMR